MSQTEIAVHNFLHKLRESGETNMIGAIPYIVDEFPNVSKKEAKTFLYNWMKSF